MDAGIYLIVEFDWPEEIGKALAQTAKQLHTLTDDGDWMREAVAASGGIGGEFSSLWVFWLKDYAALDRLFHDRENEISQTYRAFFSQMRKVHDSVREQVVFM